MKLLFFAPFIFAFCCSTLATAQIEVEKSPKSGDNKKVKVFTEENDYFDDGSKGGGGNNLIKADPLLIVVGEVPLFYERRINDFLSLEVGAGPTVATEMTVLFSDIFGMMDERFDVMYPEDATSELGLTYSLAARFYPLADGDAEGAYISPVYRYKDFRFNAPINDAFGNSTQQVRLNWKYNDFLIQGGYQYELLDNIYVDTYFGIGIRRKSIDFIERIYDPGTGYQMLAFQNLEKNTIGYSFGTKLGVRF